MIAISMRMTQQVYPGGEREIRDALSHDWWRFLDAALPDTPVIPVPNIGARAIAFLRRIPVSGIVLTGGEDWGEFPERDATEEQLIAWAERMSLPIFGVCRGAQVLNRTMGGDISSGFAEKHVRTRHILQVRGYASGPQGPVASLEVNSYHNCGIGKADLAPALEPWAIAEDGSVEAFSGDHGRITGIMWHPERESVAREHDIHLFQQHLKLVKP